MISDINEAVRLTTVNSAHVDAPWGHSWSKSTNYGDPNVANVYKGLYFHNETGILTTHVLPNYDELRSNLLNVKIILINISKFDLEEIADNNVEKNKITIDRSNFMFHYNLIQNWINRLNEMPTDLIDRILIIKYSEIYQPIGESFVALEKLKSFTNKEIGSLVMESYKTYVNNRNIKWNQ